MEIAKNFPNVKFEISGADLIEFGMELVEMAKAKENKNNRFIRIFLILFISIFYVSTTNYEGTH